MQTRKEEERMPERMRKRVAVPEFSKLPFFLLAGAMACSIASCSSHPSFAMDSPQVKPWEVEYTGTHELAILADLYDAPGEPVKGFRDWFVHPINTLFWADNPQQLPGLAGMDLRAAPMNELSRNEIKEALTVTLSPWLVTDQVLGMVVIRNAALLSPRSLRNDITYRSSPYWFTLTMEVQDARIIVIGDPGNRATETCIIADYSDQSQFDELAHTYLSLSDDQSAQPDYRPIHYRMTQGGNLFVNQEGDWGYDGYIIKVDDNGRVGKVRSFTRTYQRKDYTGEDTLTSIEFSLRY